MSKHISDKTVRNVSQNTPFSEILEKSLSRRAVMRGGLAAALATMTSFGLAGCDSNSTGGNSTDNSGGEKPNPGPGPDPEPPTSVKLGFESLPTSMTDGCVVPPGYIA
ncbi:MAG: dTDP-glucose 4,6-dehydratase, partial [Alcaligenes aquatilis]